MQDTNSKRLSEYPINSQPAEDTLIPTLAKKTNGLYQNENTTVAGIRDRVIENIDINKYSVGLGDADNTSDLDKPISTDTQEALDTKADFPTVVSSIPVSTAAGGQSSLPFTTSATTGSIVRRDSGGQINGATPTSVGHLTRKDYVDNAVATKVSKSGDIMVGRLSNTAAIIGFSQDRGGNEISFGTNGSGHFQIYNNTASANIATFYAGGNGVEFGTGLQRIVYGTGFPNGTVSAPVGSIYVDRNITNGASSWIKKSGTGTTGWIINEGDTGWRNIGRITGLAEDLKIRRINNIIYLSQVGEAMTITSLAIQTRLVTPLGFRSTMRSGFPLTITAGDTKGSILVKSTEADIILTTNTAYQEFVAVAGAQWITNDDWPTTLPGTAA